MAKKLASYALLLFASPLFITFIFHLSEAKAIAAPLNARVALTGRNLQNEQQVQPMKPTMIPHTFLPTVQAVQPTPYLPTLQPVGEQTPVVVPEQVKEVSGEFERFVAEVTDGQVGVLRGVYVEGVLALQVVQQPKNDELFVSTNLGIVTQFQNASRHGITALLAHNYLSGKLFYQLKPGQLVQLVYGNGKIIRYVISDSQRFQKLEPNNPRSRFIELSTGNPKSTDQVFNKFYTGKDHLVFQTCIKNEQDWSWGLIFITALPVQ